MLPETSAPSRGLGPERLLSRACTTVKSSSGAADTVRVTVTTALGRSGLARVTSAVWVPTGRVEGAVSDTVAGVVPLEGATVSQSAEPVAVAVKPRGMPSEVPTSTLVLAAGLPATVVSVTAERDVVKRAATLFSVV